MVNYMDDAEWFFRERMHALFGTDANVKCSFSDSGDKLYLVICKRCHTKNDWRCHCLPVGRCTKCMADEWEWSDNLALRTPVPEVFIRYFPENEEWPIHDD